MPQSNLSFEQRNLHGPVTSKNCVHQVLITYTGCHHDILLEHIFLDRMAMDLFSEIHMKSRSTQTYHLDAFWVMSHGITRILSLMAENIVTFFLIVFIANYSQVWVSNFIKTCY